MNEEQKKDYNIIIAKKSEKLVTALYLVTDLIDDAEPIKHSLRKNAVSILSLMNTLSQVEVKDRLSELKHALRVVTEVLSLLHVAHTTGLVSQMNGELLIEGWRSLQLVLEKKQPFVSKSMLAVDHEDELVSGADFQPTITSTSYDAITPRALLRLHEDKEDIRKSDEYLRKTQLLDKLEHTNKGQNKEQTTFIKDKKDFKKEGDAKPVSTHSLLMVHATRPAAQPATSFQMKKISRRDQILALFVKGVDVSIKDIAQRVKGCSEKTIQRELNALVFDNSIERIGEKRWSRYILR